MTTQPHSLRRVFISDLHLYAEEPALVQAFLALLQDLSALPQLKELYILGDWFDSWVGDDAYLSLTDVQKKSHWLTPLIELLHKISANGCNILVMHGNRDFMVGQRFCDLFKGRLINEPYFIEIDGQKFRLEHGDALCTDDKAYQRFRRIIRNPVMKWMLLRQSLERRHRLADNIKNKSALDKTEKSLEIMDVNKQAVETALHKVDMLLHGHTHRPNCHVESRQKTRYVLGDWQVINPTTTYRPSNQSVEAVIGVTLVNDRAYDAKLTDAHEDGTNHVERFYLVDFRF